jgi:hypothetical protein
VPAELPGAIGRGPVHQAAPGRVLLDVPGVARALLETDGPAAVERDPDATDEDVAWLLGGPARQARRLLDGGFAIAGAGVSIDGGAVAIVGGGASGKSVAAAALAQRGHGLLADSALEVDPDGPTALPSAGAAQLWPGILEALELDADAGAVVRPALAKRAYPFPTAPPAPLTRLVALRRRPDVGPLETQPLRGGSALDMVLEHTAMAPLIAPLGLGAEHFAWAVAVARSAPVTVVVADRHDDNAPEIADAIEAVAA